MTFLQRVATFTARVARGTFTPGPTNQELYKMFAELLKLDFDLHVAQLGGDVRTAWELTRKLGAAFRELERHGVRAKTVNEAIQKLSKEAL